MGFISSHPPQETADLLESFLSGKGMKIFARIDQAAEAAAVGLELRPTILLLFGNPKAGTPLMIQYPNLALDLSDASMRHRNQVSSHMIKRNSVESLGLGRSWSS